MGTRLRAALPKPPKDAPFFRLAMDTLSTAYLPGPRCEPTSVPGKRPSSDNTVFLAVVLINMLFVELVKQQVTRAAEQRTPPRKRTTRHAAAGQQSYAVPAGELPPLPVTKAITPPMSFSSCTFVVCCRVDFFL